MQRKEAPQLSEQICFPLYVISKEIIALYRPFLEELNLTYSQYLVMMVLWETEGLTVNQISEKVYLDSGTVTPLLKRLEAKKFLSRVRQKEDERMVEIFLTEQGVALKKQACTIPQKMQQKLALTDEDMKELKMTVDKILNKVIR